MDIQNKFKRYELKYLFSPEQYSALNRSLEGHLSPDEYGKTSVLNLYFDTPSYRIIRRSEEKPFYKEKLRLRSYCVPKENDRVFLELKKKYDSVVYKRREATTLADAKSFLETNRPFSQITEEIAYFISFYREIAPACCIFYEREAFTDNENKNLRVTFDSDILWRNYDLALEKGVYGKRIIPEGARLMEIKTDGAMPLWLTRALSENGIFRTSFSKYGRAFAAMTATSSAAGESAANAVATTATNTVTEADGEATAKAPCEAFDYKSKGDVLYA